MSTKGIPPILVCQHLPFKSGTPLWKIHPWKLTWNPKNWWFVDVFSFSKGCFSGSMLIFGGVPINGKKPRFHEESFKGLGFLVLPGWKKCELPAPGMRAIVKITSLGEILPLKSNMFWKVFSRLYYIYILYHIYILYPSIQVAIKLKLIGIYNILVL